MMSYTFRYLFCKFFSCVGIRAICSVNSQQFCGVHQVIVVYKTGYYLGLPIKQFVFICLLAELLEITKHQISLSQTTQCTIIS